jgi:hypothetical protein
MKKLGKLFVVAVLALTLLFSLVAVSVSASPVHVAGDSHVSSPVFGFSGGGVSTTSTPVHVAGD